MSGNCRSFVSATAQTNVSKGNIQATVSKQKNGGECDLIATQYKTLRGYICHIVQDSSMGFKAVLW